MQASNPPDFVPRPFADAGTKNVIPTAASPTPGLASLTTGFPPVTMLALAAGGIPPAGNDFNGILNLVTQTTRWVQAGGGFKYSSTFATDANVGGYPQGALLERADGTGFWLNTLDNNTADPDGATPTGWVPAWQSGITAVTGLTNANVTLTSLQYGRPIITLAGTLTANIQIIFPAIAGQQWLLINATTGAFSITAKTAAGAGVVIPNGQQVRVYGDGTNLLAQRQAVSGSSRVVGLVGANNSATPSTQIDFAAGSIDLRNPVTGELIGGLSAPVPITNNILLAGPAVNGRDRSGTFSASSWVHFYFITDGVNVATVSSPNAPPAGPVLPAGYAAWAYIGAAYLGASANFPYSMHFSGAWCNYDTRQIVVTGSATSPTPVSTATWVPPNAGEVKLQVTQVALTAAASGQFSLTLFIATTAGATSYQCGLEGQGAASAVTGVSGGSTVISNLNQSFEYSLAMGVGLAGSQLATIAVGGYKVPNGGE